MGEVSLHIYDTELLLQEQSDKFRSRMLLGDSFYYYLLYAEDSRLLAYAIAEPTSKSQLKFGPGFVAENLSSDKLAKLQNLNLTVFHAQRDFSLIPHKLFDETKKDQYVDNLEEGVTLYREFKFGREKLYIVWFTPARFNEILGKRYVSHQSYHVAELMLKKAEQFSSDFSSFTYALYLGKSLFVIAVKDRQLQALNAYKAESEEDLLYYTMLNHQKYGLRPQKDTLFLSGAFDKGRAEIALLGKYFAPRLTVLQFSLDENDSRAVPSAYDSLFYMLQV